MTMWVKRWGVGVLGAVLLVWGLVLVSQTTVTYGWFASVPASGGVFLAQPPLNAGAVIAVIGLTLVSGWIGFLLGRRRSRPERG